MKHKDLVRHLTAWGCRLKRQGSNHDLYENPATGKIAPIPRHKEIKDSLCMLIFKQLGLDKEG